VVEVVRRTRELRAAHLGVAIAVEALHEVRLLAATREALAGRLMHAAGALSRGLCSLSLA
jgi:hypothetical protein